MKVSDPSPRITTEFVLRGAGFDLGEVTGEIGLAPTRTLVHGGGPEAPSFDEWAIGFEKERVHEIDRPLARLLAQLWPQREAIRRLVERLDLSAAFFTLAWIHADGPIYDLEAGTLEQLASFDCPYDLKIHDRREERRR